MTRILKRWYLHLWLKKCGNTLKELFLKRNFWAVYKGVGESLEKEEKKEERGGEKGVKFGLGGGKK